MPTQTQTFTFTADPAAPRKAFISDDFFPGAGQLYIWKIKGKSRSQWREFHYWTKFNIWPIWGANVSYYSFTSIQPHDVLHLGTQQWGRRPPGGQQLFLWIQEVTKTGITCITCDNPTDALSMFFKAKVAKKKWIKQQAALRQQQQANIVSEKEVVSHYYEFLQAQDNTAKILALAKIIDWTVRGVQLTMIKGRLPSDAEKRWNKANAIRQRAGHEATGIYEKETSMRMAIRVMEPLLMDELKYVTLADAQNDPDTIASRYATLGKVKKPTAGTTARTPRTPPPGQGSSDITDIADRIEQILGEADCHVKQSKVRISIIYYPHGHKPLFAMFAKKRTVQIMCAVGDQIGWPDTDSAGTPCINIPKPVDLTEVDEIATKVRDLY